MLAELEFDIELERECTRLVLRYADLIDRASFDAFSRLFTPDAVLDLGSRVMRGRSEIRETLSKRPASVVLAHVCSNILINRTGDETAAGTCYLTYVRSEAANADGSLPPVAPNIVSVGVYEDSFVKTDEGWLFAHRRLHLRFGR